MQAIPFKTRFWTDPETLRLPYLSRYIFNYFITCPYRNKIGMFELDKSIILLETGLTEEQYKKAQAPLVDGKKVLFFADWVYVVNAMKHLNYTMYPKSIEQEKNSVPPEVLSYFKDFIDNHSFDFSGQSKLPVQEKPKKMMDTESKRQRTLIEANSEEFFNSLKEDERFKNYEFSQKFIRNLVSKIVDYEKSQGKMYKDYKATLRNWLSREIENGKVSFKKYNEFKPPVDNTPRSRQFKSFRDIMNEHNANKTI